jgi:hypothetical protein
LQTDHDAMQLVQGHLEVKGMLRGEWVGGLLTSNGLLLNILGFGLLALGDDAFHAIRHADRACRIGREREGGGGGWR